MVALEAPAPEMETQKGLVALKETPQGFTRLGGVTAAAPAVSETRLLETFYFANVLLVVTLL